MKETRDLAEFVRENQDDIIRFLLSKFRNLLKPDYTLEDYLQEFYLLMAHSKSLEKYDPERGVKFSTYIYQCFFNFSLSFPYARQKREKKIQFVSLDNNFKRQLEDKAAPDPNPIDDLYKSLQVFCKSNPHLKRYKLVNLFEKYILEYRDAEIARIENVSTATIGYRKKMLREILEISMI